MNDVSSFKLPIRICLYDQVVTVGGIRNFEYELLSHWERILPDTWNCTVFWPDMDSSGAKLIWPFSNSKILLQRIPWQSSGQINNRLIRSIRHLCDWSNKLKKSSVAGALSWALPHLNKYDLIFFPNPFRMLQDGIKPVFSRPIAITLHDLAHEFTNSWGECTAHIRREVKTWTELASGIIFSSDWIKEQAIKIYNIPESKTYRVYLAPNIPQRFPNSKEVGEVLSKYNLPKGYALCLSAAAPHKGHLTILEGFAHLRRDYNIHLPLVIAGPQTNAFVPGTATIGPHWLNVQKAIDNFGFKIGQDLFCLGFVSDNDVPALYLGSSMVVTASQSEAGLNSMIFDGMWYERPIVCSNIPVFVERLGKSGTLAYIFEAGNAIDLAMKIRMVIQETVKTKEMVKRAKQFVLARNWTDVANDYLNVFEQVLQKIL